MSFANIYQYLDVDGEASVTPAKAAPKETKPAAQSKTAPAKTATQATKTTQQSSTAKTTGPRDSRRGDRQEGRGGYRNQGDRPPRPQGEQRDRLGVATEGSEPQPVEFARRDRGENPNHNSESRGDQRRRGAPAGGFMGNKRVFDRQSGTGRPPREEKRGGKGRGNWGAADGADEAAEVVAEEGKEVATGEAAAETKVEEPEVETEEQRLRREEREKEAKQIGLDDYFKLREEKRSQSSALSQQHKVRQANEGVDPAQAKKWGAFQALQRDEEENTVTENQAEKTKKKSKNTVPFTDLFTVKEQPRQQYDDERRGARGPRGGRDERRGGDDRRGGDRRSAPRGQGQSHAAQGVDFSDPTSFPTLQHK